MSRDRQRVLVVDDDDALREAIARMLAGRFHVERASDGAEVILRVTAGELFDLIVMDLEMPRMNGRDTLQRLEEIAPLLARRTVIMTGGSSILELQRWVEGLGPGRLLLKPFSPTRLREAIDELMAG